MSPDEALRLCRIAKSVSPAQAVDEYTPEAWALILRNVRFVDAQEALAQLGGEQEWIHVSHIVKRVKAMRSDRIKKFGPFEVPDNLTPEEYARFIETTHRRIADGLPVDVQPTKPMVERPSHVPELEAATPAPEREEVRRRTREAHRAARQEAKAAEPPRCSCGLDGIASGEPADDCAVHTTTHPARRLPRVHDREDD